MENIKDLLEKIFDEHNQVKPFLKKNITVDEAEDQLNITIKVGFTFKNLEQNYKNKITECLGPKFRDSSKASTTLTLKPD